MREAQALCADHVDAVDELIISFALALPGTSIKEIEEQWTIDDFTRGWIFLKRKQWMDEAHTLMLQEQQDAMT